MSFPPHDLLKVAYWKKHYDISKLPKFLQNTITGKAIEEHHDKWISDRLAACIARLFFDGTEFIDGDLDGGTLFFIPVYENKDCQNGVIKWDSAKRKELQEKLFKIYEEEYKKGGKNWEKIANNKVNKELMYFPADTWTPFVSLMAHHAITYILHTPDEGYIKHWIEEIAPKKGEIPELILLFIGIPEIEVYRLKELRKFHSIRKYTLKIIRRLLSKLNIRSIKIGDEVITLVVNYKIRDKPLLESIINEIIRSNIRCTLRIISIPIKKEISEKRRKSYWIIADKPIINSYTVGTSLESGFEVGRAEWAKHLEAKEVAWICIKPKGNIITCCEEFIKNYAIEIMDKIAQKYGFEFSKKIEPKFLASPDLMLTIIQDYHKFLNDVRSYLHLDSSILMSFSKSLFIVSIHDRSKAFRIYERLLDIAKNLHISIEISMIVTHSKFPFWKVLELIDIYSNKFTIYPRGGMPVSLKPEDFKLMKDMIPIVKEIKSTVWKEEIVPVSIKSLEEFEFELERLSSGSKQKINQYQKEKILNFIKELENNHKDESEESKRKIRYSAFNRLSDFAGEKT